MAVEVPVERTVQYDAPREGAFQITSGKYHFSAPAAAASSSPGDGGASAAVHTRVYRGYKDSGLRSAGITTLAGHKNSSGIFGAPAACEKRNPREEECPWDARVWSTVGAAGTAAYPRLCVGVESAVTE